MDNPQSADAASTLSALSIVTGALAFSIVTGALARAPMANY